MKRKISSVLAVLISAALLSSCGGSGQSSSGAPADAQTSVSASADGEQSSNEGSTQENTTDENTASEKDPSSQQGSSSSSEQSGNDPSEPNGGTSMLRNLTSAIEQAVENSSPETSNSQGSANGNTSQAGNSDNSSTVNGQNGSSANNGGTAGGNTGGGSSGTTGGNTSGGNSGSTGGNTGGSGSTGGNTSGGNSGSTGGNTSGGNGGSTGENTSGGSSGTTGGNTSGGSSGSTGGNTSGGNSGGTNENQPEEKTTEENPPAPVSTEIGDINTYNQLFDLSSKVTVSISMTKSEMDKLDRDYYTYKNKNSKSPIYRKCDVTINVGGVSYFIDEVGIRLKGNMSLEPVYDSKTGKLNLTHYKLSFSETFDDKDYYGSEAKQWTDDAKKARKNRRFATLKKLDLKWNRNYDNTYIREIYAAKMFRQSGVLAQNIGLSQVQFNEQNYGVFMLYEPVDKIFLERYLPESALGGDLYKVGWTNSPANYVSGQVSYGVEDEEKGGRITSSKLENVIDTDYFCKFLAASYFAGDPDDMRNNYNNHYIYFRKDNGKAIFIVYDNDRTLGVTKGYNPDKTGMTGQSPYSDRAAGAGNSQANPLIKLVSNSSGLLRSRYTEELKRIAALPLWDESEFEKEYYKAKNTYEAYITPTVSFANAKSTFRFSLEGAYTTSNKTNMSYHEFITRIMKTYHTYVK